MKTILTGLLVLALSASQVNRAKASGTVAMGCVVLSIMVVAGGAIVLLAQRCKTYSWCCHDPESDTQWCRAMTRGAAKLLGTNVLSGPYDTMALCNIPCSQMPTNQAQVFSYSLSSDPGDTLPAKVMIQKSVDLVNWEDVGVVDLDVTLDEQPIYWNLSPNRPQEFYRVREQL